jgi:hypothetical protein
LRFEDIPVLFDGHSRRLFSADSCSNQEKCLDFSEPYPVCNACGVDGCFYYVCITFNKEKTADCPNSFSHTGLNPELCTSDEKCPDHGSTDGKDEPFNDQMCAYVPAPQAEEENPVKFAVVKDGNNCEADDITLATASLGFTCKNNYDTGTESPLVCNKIYHRLLAFKTCRDVTPHSKKKYFDSLKQSCIVEEKALFRSKNVFGQSRFRYTLGRSPSPHRMT